METQPGIPEIQQVIPLIHSEWRERMLGETEATDLVLEESLDTIIENVYLTATLSDFDPKRIRIKFKGHSLNKVINEYQILKEIVLAKFVGTNEAVRSAVVETILFYMGLAAWEWGLSQTRYQEELQKDLERRMEIETKEKLWFEAVLDYLPVGVVIVERLTGEILFSNAFANKLSGGEYPRMLLPYDENNYVTDALGLRVPYEELPRFRVARGEKLSGYEITWHWPGGKLTCVMHSAIVPATEEKPERILLVFQEIEARKKKEDYQLSILKDLDQEKVLREQFVSALSHDLKTPLTSARLALEMLMRKLDPHQRKRAGIVLQNIERVDGMISDLLDANRMKAGQKLPIEVKEVDLNRLIESTVYNLNTIHGDRIVMELPEKIAGRWSPKSLRRIFENLLLNAIKYGDSSPIVISARRVVGEVWITVHNNGNPIPERDQTTIFQQFYRAPNSMNIHHGWGIGLSLVRGLVEAHNGKVELASSEAEGTTFTVKLPVSSG